ncbi:hypothetical protein C8J57DRAFT_1553556 [Mycena rebaudengoi]|nr:hypothetical protein C8J57DRAFT_1553556 [Mycena rebaudengoi]
MSNATSVFQTCYSNNATSSTTCCAQLNGSLLNPSQKNETGGCIYQGDPKAWPLCIKQQVREDTMKVTNCFGETSTLGEAWQLAGLQMEEAAAVTLAEFMKFNSKDLFDVECRVEVAGDVSGLAGDKPSPGLAERHASWRESKWWRQFKKPSLRSQKIRDNRQNQQNGALTRQLSRGKSTGRLRFRSIAFELTGSRGLRPSSVRSKKYLKDGAALLREGDSLIGLA